MDNLQKIILSCRDRVNPSTFLLYKDKLENCDEKRIDSLIFLELKNPVVGFLLGLVPALFLYGLTFDRLYKGDLKLGIFKIILWLLIPTTFIIALIIDIDIENDEMSNGAIGLLIFCFIDMIVLFIWNLCDFFLVWLGIKKDNIKRVLKHLGVVDENHIGNKQPA